MSSYNKPVKDQLIFHLIDVDSGLSNNFVNSIEQDSLGFIWIATAGGLNRYDGIQFLNFKKNQSDLSNNNISQIKFDEKSGNLLVSTDAGLNIYNPKKETFNLLPTTNTETAKAVNCVTIAPDKNIVLGMVREEKGLHIIKPNGSTETYTHDPKNTKSISSNEISSITMQKDSIVWIGTFDGGLNKMNYKNREITRVASKEKKRFSKTIYAIHVDSDDNVWIGSKNGLHVITKTKDTLSLSASTIIEKGLSDNSVLCFQEDLDGQMWVGTRNGGLNIFDKCSFLSKKTNLKIKWYLPQPDGSSVYNRTVSAIKLDQNGDMWLGTSTGINYVKPKGEPVKLIQRNNLKDDQSISHNRIGSLGLASNNNIWVGTDGGGLDLFDPKLGTFTNFKHNHTNYQSLSNDYILSVLEDSKNRVWVGTYQGGLNLLNPNQNTSEKYLQGTIAEGSDVRTIFEDHIGQIWVGTNRGGLYKYNEEENLFDSVKVFEKMDIRDIKQDNSNNLWIATFGEGIIRYNYLEEQIVFYNKKNTKGINTNIFFCVLPLANGDLLAGSRYNGLIRLNPKTKTSRSIVEQNGLSNNTVNSIVQENDTIAWLGTSNGINQYNIKKHKINDLSILDNIQTSEFNIGAALKSPNGLLYFGGNKGLNIFYPKKIEQKKNNYKLVFQNIELFNKPISDIPEKENSTVNKSISYKKKIELNYDTSLFSIGFTVLKYPFSKNIKYFYKLNGYNDHWVKKERGSLATFSNIPPGNYTLKIKAVLDSGPEIFNELDIIISPPFWKTYPAYFIYLLFLIGIIIVGLRYYSERLKLKNSLLFEKKQRQLEHELNEERIHFFTNFSHELKTPLTLILANTEDLLLQLKHQKYLQSVSIVKKNALKLFQSINKLLEFRKSENGLSQLYLTKHNIALDLVQLVENYHSLAQQKNIHLATQIPEEPIEIQLDLEKFQVIINNLLSNAFKHCEAGDEIHVSLSLTDKNVVIKVLDSGPGLHPDDLPYIFDWYFQTDKPTRKKGAGIGLALTKSFVELHGGKIYAKNNEINKGALFTVVLPLNISQELNLTTNNENTKTFIEISETDVINSWTPSSIEIPRDHNPSVNLDKSQKLILIIDDNQDILQYLEGLLKNEFDLIFANNGKEGIEKAVKYIPNIIISDITMPKKNGIDVCSELKQYMATSHIPIILLTAKDNAESIKCGFIEGADDYITKPFNGQILKARINNILKNRERLKKHFLAPNDTLTNFNSTDYKLLDREKEFLTRLKSIILERLSKDQLSVDAVTQSIGMSRSSLFRKIKAITGKNINDFISKVRLEKAAHLIKVENMGISQASYEVGFKSIKHFRKLFKDEFGVTPSEYKKNTKPNLKLVETIKEYHI